MAIDLFLTVVFIGTAGYAAAMVWRKIPLLLQVPQQLIEESFVTRPSPIRKYARPVIEFFRERRYLQLYYAGLVRTLHWIRLWLLRLERVVYRMLQALQERDRGISETEERYWSELKQWKHEGKQNGGRIPHEVIAEPAPTELTSKGSPKNITPR